VGTKTAITQRFDYRRHCYLEDKLPGTSGIAVPVRNESPLSVHFKNRKRRMAQAVGCVVVVLTKTVVPKSVVGGNDDEIYAKLKRKVQYAFAGVTRTKYPFTVWIGSSDRRPLLFQSLFRLPLILQEVRLWIGPTRSFE
jgi:hypothetical protein